MGYEMVIPPRVGEFVKALAPQIPSAQRAIVGAVTAYIPRFRCWAISLVYEHNSNGHGTYVAPMVSGEHGARWREIESPESAHA